MALYLVPDLDYDGVCGLAQLRQLQSAMADAHRAEDWLRVRQLDRACAGLVERLIAANSGDQSALVQALSELKGVYANLIQRYQQVSSLAL